MGKREFGGFAESGHLALIEVCYQDRHSRSCIADIVAQRLNRGAMPQKIPEVRGLAPELSGASHGPCSIENPAPSDTRGGVPPSAVTEDLEETRKTLRFGKAISPKDWAEGDAEGNSCE
jgi:hypothetical protein